MLEILKFVQGAVSKKDFVPALKHFRIQNGTIQGFNGALALSSPIDLNLACTPQAIPFIKAIQTCKETVQLHLTPAGRLSIKSGSFSAFVECLPEDKPFPTIAPAGFEVKMDGELLLKALRTLVPFIGQDASRPWARGILFRGASAYAANNIILVEKWVGSTFPELNVPEESVSEILRIGEPPVKVQAEKGSVTFHYSSGRWLRSQLLSTEWPDISRLLERDGGNEAIPTNFFDSLEDLVPFLGDEERCYLKEGYISTSKTSEDGARIEIADQKEGGCWNLKQLLLLKSIAKTLGLSKYPEPCLFFGDNLRGVIVGMHM